ncbi:MAG TPA: M23 family metallopeptidase [Clostridiales bacterium]|nr:MAG: Murein DD-endopeptidase MepM [Firmicutes bacterium ADurb.Bin262]HQK72896.1 M23 family metallopeptidase [Clostridiales bacterium]
MNRLDYYAASRIITFCNLFVTFSEKEAACLDRKKNKKPQGETVAQDAGIPLPPVQESAVSGIPDFESLYSSADFDQFLKKFDDELNASVEYFTKKYIECAVEPSDEPPAADIVPETADLTAELQPEPFPAQAETAGTAAVETSYETGVQAEAQPAVETPVEKSPVRQEAERGVFEKVYRFEMLVGVQTMRYGKRFFKRLRRVLLKPAGMLRVLLRLMLLTADKLFLRYFTAFHREANLLRTDVRGALRGLRESKNRNILTLASIVRHYTVKALTRHRRFFKTVFNTLLPAGALAALLLVFAYYNNAGYALRVTLNANQVGFVQNEAVVNSALADATGRLQDPDTVQSSSRVIGKTSYELSVVPPGQLSDEKDLSDKLIEGSAVQLGFACGVYIDGERICAVANESDARGVFESMLEPYKADKANSIVTFVEKITYSQGLYPVNKDIMWDAATLADYLRKPKVGKKIYVVKEGDTDYSIAIKYGLNEKKLKAMNPDMGEYIHEGDRLVVSNEVNAVNIKTVRTVVTRDTIGYKTIKTPSSSLYKGDKKVLRKGRAGIVRITTLVTYINGEAVSSKPVSRVVVEQPVDMKIAVGTKSRYVYSGGSSSSSYSHEHYTVSVSTDGYVWPVPGLHSISSYYGYRWGRMHSGVDISGGGASGKIVVAAKSGTVEYAGWDGSYGNTIIINHGGGVKTRYAHLQGGSLQVYPGKYVSAGQAIARVGSSGNATGPHLHFEVIVNGYRVNPLNFI